MMTLRLGLALLMAGTGLGGAALAQGITQRPFGETAGDALTRNLRLIADQPRNVSALIGAGRAALELGDPQAALTFFARAEEIAPRDGRVKAGMGAVFVQTEQVAAALQFFKDAAALGTPEAEFAADRGLAYDLSGDPRRAQADYMLALRRQENPEVRRRLALSLAISGERDKAIATIDSQLRAQDRAAWRVRSFILALTGDAAEATRSAEAVMPAQAAQLRPFFAALPRLKPADRASAVHFGHFPDDPNAMQMASAPTQYASAAPSASASAGVTSTDSGRVARRTTAPAPASTAPRRRPGTEETTSPRPARQASSNILAERYGWTGRGVTPRRTEPSSAKPTALADAGQTARASARPALTAPPTPAPQQQSLAAQAQSAPAAEAQPATQPPAPAQTQAPAASQIQGPQTPVAAPSVQAQPQAQPSSSATEIAPSTFTLTSPGGSPAVQPQPAAPIQTTQVAPSQIQPQFGSTGTSPAATSSAAPAPEQPKRSGLADIAAAIESLPTETPAQAVKAEPKPSPPTQLASNNVSKPAYGPKFETPKAQVAKATVNPAKEAKSAAASKKEEGKAPSKKDDPKTAASKKDEDAKSPSAKKDTAGKSATAKKEEPKAKEPSRHWVQIAGGANEAAMEREFLRLKTKAPKLLSARTPWTTPLKATNRLLVGPFKSADDAQDFVNELSKQGVPAFSWTSPAGQEIVKLASK